MQKKNNPRRPAPPSKASSPASPPSRKPPTPPSRQAGTPPSRPAPTPPSRPAPTVQRRPGVVGRANVPPRRMVTAEERMQQRQQRRAAAAIPPPPAAATAAAAATTAEALQLELDRFNSLQSRLYLTQINDDLEDIAAAINSLPANLENIRARGYVFKSYLERKIETLANQWAEVRPRVEQAVHTETQALRLEASRVQHMLTRQQLAGPALSALETKLGAAIRNCEGMYDTLDSNINQTQRQLDDISWTLQQAEQASFGFLATESPVEAVPANWKKPGDKDGVDGVLFLTDQRLLFEQKEEVATKKVLFFTTEKQKVQSLQWAVPVGEVAKAVGSRRGLMGKDDFLTLTLNEGTGLKGPSGEFLYDDMGRPLNTTELHLKGESGEAWQGFIGRVKSGEIDRERTEPVDAEAAATVANAPTKCPNCGATITQTILRGQTEITCEFCGSVIRLGTT